MSKTITPKYAMTVRCAGIIATDSCWRGRPSEKALRAHLLAYNESIQPGGVNAHVGKAFGVEKARAVSGTIIRNDGTREILFSVSLAGTDPETAFWRAHPERA
jgi:hypothetical protein